jgi:hypothetical protein
MSLPNELLDNIIYYTLPGALTDLAKTCERLQTLCEPFFERHHQLCAQFRNFQYMSRHMEDVDTQATASDLISFIANEPQVAGYIGRADLQYDTSCFNIQRTILFRPRPVPSIESGAPIVRLFAESRYLQRAGLDWREYYSHFAEDVENNRYSQHGCVFLLTLLRNVYSVTLPRDWSPNAAADKLLHTFSNAPGTSFTSSRFQNLVVLRACLTSASRNGNASLSWVAPFLTLRRLREIIITRGLAIGTSPVTMAFRDSPYVAETLQRADLQFCCIDTVGITDFLRNTPQLKTLIYSHDTLYAHLPQDWDVCGFITQ